MLTTKGKHIYAYENRQIPVEILSHLNKENSNHYFNPEAKSNTNPK